MYQTVHFKYVWFIVDYTSIKVFEEEEEQEDEREEMEEEGKERRWLVLSVRSPCLAPTDTNAKAGNEAGSLSL